MTAGRFVSIPTTSSKWSAISPTVFFANTSGCAFASSTVLGSSGQPGEIVAKPASSNTVRQRSQLIGSSQSPWTNTTGVRPDAFACAICSASYSVIAAMRVLLRLRLRTLRPPAENSIPVSSRSGQRSTGPPTISARPTRHRVDTATDRSRRPIDSRRAFVVERVLSAGAPATGRCARVPSSSRGRRCPDSACSASRSSSQPSLVGQTRRTAAVELVVVPAAGSDVRAHRQSHVRLGEQPDLDRVDARPSTTTHTCASPRYSRNMSPRWNRRVHASLGSSHCARSPANNGRPGSASRSTARSSSAAARDDVGARPGRRLVRAARPRPPARAAKIVRRVGAASTRTARPRRPRPGLNTPNADATTSGSTWPSNDPRLVKYAGAVRRGDPVAERTRDSARTRASRTRRDTPARRTPGR